MSITKHVWIDQDPRYEDVRESYRQSAFDAAKQFKFRIPLRRRGTSGRPYWEPAWPYCVNRALTQLGLETVQLNSGLYFRHQEELDKAKILAEQLFSEYPNA